jgi:hypothetical protein
MILFAIKMKSVVVELLVRKLTIFYDFSDLLWSKAEENVFGFEIGVDNSADSVEKVKSHEDLSSDFLDQIKW